MKKQSPQYAAYGMPGVVELLVSALVLLVPVYLIWRFVSYLRTSDAERRRLRIEVSKLGHELEAMRKKNVDVDVNKSNHVKES